MPIALEGRRRWLIMPVLALGISLIIVDSTIVNVALPQIIDGLHLDLSQAEWTNSLYSLVFAALLIAVGATADRFGRRRIFIMGVVATAAITEASANTMAPMTNSLRLP